MKKQPGKSITSFVVILLNYNYMLADNSEDRKQAAPAAYRRCKK